MSNEAPKNRALLTLAIELALAIPMALSFAGATHLLATIFSTHVPTYGECYLIGLVFGILSMTSRHGLMQDPDYAAKPDWLKAVELRIIVAAMTWTGVFVAWTVGHVLGWAL